MIKRPPHGRIRYVRNQTGRVAPIVALDAVTSQNLLGNVQRHIEPRPSLLLDAQRIDRATRSLGAHAQHHGVLRNHVEWHNDRLAHQRGTATGDQRFHLWTSAVLRQQMAHTFVRADIEDAREYLHAADPEAAIQAGRTFGLEYLGARVDHAGVHVALELHLQLGLDQGQRVEARACREAAEHGEREELGFVHHVPFDGADKVGRVQLER